MSNLQHQEAGDPGFRSKDSPHANLDLTGGSGLDSLFDHEFVQHFEHTLRLEVHRSRLVGASASEGVAVEEEVGHEKVDLLSELHHLEQRIAEYESIRITLWLH